MYVILIQLGVPITSNLVNVCAKFHISIYEYGNNSFKNIAVFSDFFCVRITTGSD